ncbi:DUF2760 domain-containing protein [Cysteiniphilum litorale]|uniref:DUF2760 domain-containing protein n=2 Tax=Cysteiniphilum TaxID=2056696 RepID=A0A8J2Z6L8_9GAMM|nr:DUF2760 domain-containing protein [Cysteiniphilum litorale]GGG06026.1 hypothetical protein GCM10010995_24370 [Cysteiniphilum litorale]
MPMKLTWRQRLSCLIKGKLENIEAKPVADAQQDIGCADEDAESTESAKQLLSILQKKGRLLDFLAQNLDHYDNEQVATVARVVHDQCKKALESYCTLVPVYHDQENHEVILEANYDKYSVELTGNVVHSTRFKGKLIHQGWKVEKMHLPKVAKEANLDILQPAEVEVL